MNARQRRGVILLVLSVLCALGAFAGVVVVISDVQAKVGPEVTAYRVKADVPAYAALRPAQFEKITMPERWLSTGAIRDLTAIRGKIAVAELRKGSLLQKDMVADRPALESGQQEIAIMIDASTGVAGKITAGARVNIFATFDDEGRGKNAVAESRLIVAGARVLDVGRLTPIDQRDNDRTGPAGGEAVPITFALTTADAQRVAYAESFAEHVRLALLPSDGPATLKPGESTYTLDEDKNK
ncbi:MULTISPECIES: Flp pilus assembly protein CpaB [Streptomyces]|uniref:Pilus assembly protein CpaB n=2 Tax=Streptomyces TaxID=1883 RepID=A0A117IX69_9ACTN|nr:MULTISPECIES: Flp pilus assembly protein CpaB [Streptomyces]KUH39277.1 pilus assembly protein CpaB [Streptomyces kanasensis]UUS32726.1 Flp pilus assembly protein CpaB [Streptomyces changanensis]